MPIANSKDEIENISSKELVVNNKIKIEDFNIFLGIKRSSSNSNVLKMFENIAEEKSTPTNLGLIVCGDDIIHVTYNKTLGLVRSITLRATSNYRALLAQLKVDDPKIHLLGKDKSYILDNIENQIQAFDSNFIFYEVEKLKVSFKIYQNKCDTIAVYFS